MQNFYGRIYIMTGLLAISTSLLAMELDVRQTQKGSKKIKQETAITLHANNNLYEAQQQREAAVNAHLTLLANQQETAIILYANNNLEKAEQQRNAAKISPQGIITMFSQKCTNCRFF